MKDEPQHPIQVVSRRTGLSPDVLRVWERRYRAVTPNRSPTNRRLYSDEDIERLRLLRRATAAGRRIGEVSRLSREELEELVLSDEEAIAEVTPHRPRSGANGQAREHLGICLAAVKELDSARLARSLSNAAVDLSAPALVEDLLVPLMRQIGDEWQAGSLRAAHEHLATSQVRTFLANLGGSSRNGANPARIIVTTPAGQIHELGALMASVSAALEGWEVTYLGPDLPAEEIAAAARQKSARAVALSLIHPADDASVLQELERLRRLLDDDVSLIVGGHVAVGYRRALHDMGVKVRDGFAEFRAELETLRSGSG